MKSRGGVGPRRDMAPVQVLGHERDKAHRSHSRSANGFRRGYEVGDVPVETVFGGLAGLSTPKGIALRGRLRLSSVTPLPNFVIPTTGGSPFLTNSQSPVNQKE